MKRQYVGKYELIGKLGEGGMAEVYKAYDPQTERYVAIKLIHTILGEKTGIQRKFRREGLLVAGLNHPAIVAVEEFGEIEDRLFIVMPLMEGGDLADRLAHNTRFSLAEAFAFARRLAPALDHIHSLGIVHSDLKPGNILYGQDGLPYISDFGVARLQEPQPYTLSTLLFTPSYASPEQFEEGEPDGRSDLYSFGLILYKALTGDLPYDATTPAQWMRAHLTATIPDIRKIRPDLPKGIEKVFYKILAKSPKDRYQQGIHFANDLAQFVEKQPSPRVLQLPGKQFWAYGTIGTVIVGLGIVVMANIGPLFIEQGQPGNSQEIQTVQIEPTLLPTNTTALAIVIAPSSTPTPHPTLRATSTSRTTPQSVVIHTPTQSATTASTSTRIVTRTPSQTPTATPTHTPTASPTPSPTHSPTISPTRVSTATSPATNTPQPTATPPPAPSSTPIPSPTQVPPTQPPAQIASFNARVIETVSECQQTKIYGEVHEADGSPLPGVKIQVWESGSNIYTTMTSGPYGGYIQSASGWGITFSTRPLAGTWHVAVIDDSGNLISNELVVNMDATCGYGKTNVIRVEIQRVP